MAINLYHLSPRNQQYSEKRLQVANGEVFVVLDMPEKDVLNASHVLYIHYHRDSRRCYIGQSLKKCSYRWGNGRGYRAANQPKFRAAIDRYGWEAFDSYIVAFCDNQDQLDQAEVDCIAAAGGHKSLYVFNLSPGGRAGADRSEAIEGYNLETGEWRRFDNSVEAAEYIGVQGTHVRKVVKEETKSAKGWWFRLAGSISLPPTAWGLGSGEQKKKAVLAVRLSDKSEFMLDSISAAARMTNAHSSNVTRAVKQENGGVCNGYWLRYADSSIEMPQLVGRAGSVYKNGKPVIATNVATGEERTFLSGRAAATALGVDAKNIPAALKGRVKTLGGWKFRYAD